MKKAMDFLRTYRLGEKGVFVGDSVLDPNETMLVGTAYGCSTDEGYLDAKITTLNPNFAAVVVELLHQANVKKGDTIAVAYTGSMPGANIATLAACEIMEVKPVIISSVGASWYGATDTNFTWLDIERILYKNHIFSHKSLFASLGGKSDIGRGLTVECQEALQGAIARNDIDMIYERDWRNSITKRIHTYKKIIPLSNYKSFLNIGGGITSLGVGENKPSNGVLFPEDLQSFQSKSVVKSFTDADIPIINIRGIKQLTKLYGLPYSPTKTPQIGTGRLFMKPLYNKVINFLALLFSILATAGIGIYSHKQIQNRMETHEPESIL
jgi:poly-gamma-glutamate system protein